MNDKYSQWTQQCWLDHHVSSAGSGDLELLNLVELDIGGCIIYTEHHVAYRNTDKNYYLETLEISVISYNQFLNYW